MDETIEKRAHVACGKFMASHSVEHAEEAVSALKTYIAEFEEDFS